MDMEGRQNSTSSNLPKKDETSAASPSKITTEENGRPQSSVKCEKSLSIKMTGKPIRNSKSSPDLQLQFPSMKNEEDVSESSQKQNKTDSCSFESETVPKEVSNPDDKCSNNCRRLGTIKPPALKIPKSIQEIPDLSSEVCPKMEEKPPSSSKSTNNVIGDEASQKPNSSTVNALQKRNPVRKKFTTTPVTEIPSNPFIFTKPLQHDQVPGTSKQDVSTVQKKTLNKAPSFPLRPPPRYLRQSSFDHTHSLTDPHQNHRSPKRKQQQRSGNEPGISSSKKSSSVSMDSGIGASQRQNFDTDGLL